MSEPAQVRSVEAIERFRFALAEFEKQVQGALERLDGELQRVDDWLENDCPRYWIAQEKSAADAVHQAKLDLERCLIFPVAGEQPACREERAVLEATQARLAECQEKRVTVRHWRGNFQHEQFEYSGRIGQLKRILEVDLPAARAKLQLIERRIVDYAIEQVPLHAKPIPPAANIERN